MSSAAVAFASQERLEIAYREGDSFIGNYGNVLVGASAGQKSYAGLEASYVASVPEAVPWLTKQCASEAHFDPSGLIQAVASIR